MADTLHTKFKELLNQSTPYARGALLLGLLNALILIVLLSLLVGLVMYVQRLRELPPLQAFSADNPQAVQETHVPPDGTVHVTGTKCNLTDETLSVDGITYLVQESPVRRRWLRSETVGSAWPAGCRTSEFANDLRVGVPSDVTLEPGIYHLEGTNTIRHHNQRQDVPWYTESFEIVAE